MRMLLSAAGQRSIAARLAAMTAACALFMVLVAVTVLLIARAELMAERDERAHAVIDSTWSIANRMQHAVVSGAVTADEAKARFTDAAGAISYDGQTNSLFVYDTETGLCVVNRANPSLLGKDVRGLRDSGGMLFASAMIDIAKYPGEGTVRYTFPRGAMKAPQDKVAYVRGFAPWHLMIRTAEYMSEIDTTFGRWPGRRSP
jgi:methyl-accepting chemotaxis protein